MTLTKATGSHRLVFLFSFFYSYYFYTNKCIKMYLSNIYCIFLAEYFFPMLGFHVKYIKFWASIPIPNFIVKTCNRQPICKSWYYTGHCSLQCDKSHQRLPKACHSASGEFYFMNSNTHLLHIPISAPPDIQHYAF